MMFEFVFVLCVRDCEDRCEAAKLQFEDSNCFFGHLYSSHSMKEFENCSLWIQTLNPLNILTSHLTINLSNYLYVLFSKLTSTLIIVDALEFAIEFSFSKCAPKLEVRG